VKATFYGTRGSLATPGHATERYGGNTSCVLVRGEDGSALVLDAGTGTIVNIASLAGKNGVEGGTAYCASKHAVLGFSKSLMLEVRKRGLRVVAICPGSVATPFMDKRERVRPAPDRALSAEDVAHAVVATLTVSDRAMISEVDIRPTNP